ncbi:oligosaccharide flippase family protein [Pseudonocardia sp. CA-107938]|uniref:oligosaccharide flippase family protein n=1 Tax=Pseudonocardia sp. CA-107938 TaxID=3240021 RepID=UPI003D8B5615
MTPPAGRLGAILRRGALMSTAALVVVQAVGLAQTLVLARLLSPAEVGVFAAGTLLTTVLAAIGEGALTQALIQRADADLDDAADTVFWATLAGGVVMSLAVLAASPLVGALFGSATAGTVAAVTSGGLVLHALTNVPDTLMQRRFDFRRRLVVDPATVLTFAVVSVSCAAAGLGVWALVVGSYAQLAVWVGLGWALAGWRPGRGRPTVAMWRELARFGLPLMLATLGERLRETAELVVLGRALDTAALGFHRYAKRIALLPGMVVLQAGAFVLFPAFARIAGERERFRDGFLSALTWAWLMALPLAGLFVAAGESVAVLLLGEPWRPAGVALTAMAGIGLGQTVTAVAVEALKGAGAPQRLYLLTVVGLVTATGLLLVLVRFGLFGVGLAMSAAALAVAATALWQVRDVVGVAGRELGARLLGPLAAAAVATAIVATLERTVIRAADHPVAAGLALVTAEALLLAGLHLALLRLAAPAAARTVAAAARAALRRR